MTNLAYALEVDEKLTVRIMRTSETRKTIMVNRGTEDGLVEGDHAKFVVTSGIIARGVCVKVSPSRSVWSIYRLVNADFMVNDSVMTLKITPAVKITKDESQALVQEDTPTKVSDGDVPIGIPLAEGAQDLKPGMGKQMSDADFLALQESQPISLVDKNTEVFGMLNVSGLTSRARESSGGTTYNNSQSAHHLGLGGEFYSRREREWYSHWSFQGTLNLMRTDAQSFNGNGVTNDVTELEIGTNWHPTKLPSVSQDFIPFFHLGIGVGSVKSTFKSGSDSLTQKSFSENGTTQSFSGGFGYKYYTASGWGFRALLDYYVRTETYKKDDLGNQFVRSIGGPRFMLGLGYRF